MPPPEYFVPPLNKLRDFDKDEWLILMYRTP